MQNTPVFVAPGSIRIRGGEVLHPAEFEPALEQTNERLDAILAEEVGS